VKIQLRFCAEAYSRMAQVQQYVPLVSIPNVSAECVLHVYFVGISTLLHETSTRVVNSMLKLKMSWDKYES
jgi:hypothetical protein